MHAYVRFFSTVISLAAVVLVILAFAGVLPSGSVE